MDREVEPDPVPPRFASAWRTALHFCGAAGATLLGLHSCGMGMATFVPGSEFTGPLVGFGIGLLAAAMALGILRWVPRWLKPLTCTAIGFSLLGMLLTGVRVWSWSVHWLLR